MILVGEMRDLETIPTALTAAETGHLVFATLHTQNAPQTIDRIIDVFPAHQQDQVRVQLSVALQGVMTQQLLPTADGSSRVVACEVLVPTPAVRNLIREGKTHQIPSAMQTGSSVGMQTMDAALATLVRAGQDHPARSPRPRSSTPEELRRLLGMGGSAWPPSAPRATTTAVRAMATYVFKAMDLTGAKATGEVEAESKQAVADQLKQRGLIVLDIADKRALEGDQAPLHATIKPSDLTIMTRQLSTMVSSGMTILRALYVLEAQTENKPLAEVIVKVRKDVEAGLPLSDALERHPKIFSPLFVAMTRAGETGGVLEESLLRVADQLEKEDSLRRQVKSAMIYPAVVLTFALIVLVGLVDFLVPVFVGVFEQFGGDLPAITKFTVALSNIIKGYWYVLIVGDRRRRLGFRKWKSTTRAAGSGTPSACASRSRSATSSRRSRSPAGRARSARSSAPASRCCGARHHGADRGQPRRRERDGRRHRVGQARRHDRRPAQELRRLPGHGQPHGRRRRGDRRARHDARRRSPTSTRTRSTRRSSR